MRHRIRELREDNDYTQKYVAEQIMCDPSLYAKYEREERDIPLNIVLKLADFYHVSVDYILDLTDIREPYGKRK